MYTPLHIYAVCILTHAHMYIYADVLTYIKHTHINAQIHSYVNLTNNILYAQTHIERRFVCSRVTFSLLEILVALLEYGVCVVGRDCVYGSSKRMYRDHTTPEARAIAFTTCSQTLSTQRPTTVFHYAY